MNPFKLVALKEEFYWLSNLIPGEFKLILYPESHDASVARWIASIRIRRVSPKVLHGKTGAGNRYWLSNAYLVVQRGDRHFIVSLPYMADQAKENEGEDGEWPILWRVLVAEVVPGEKVDPSKIEALVLTGWTDPDAGDSLLEIEIYKAAKSTTFVDEMKKAMEKAQNRVRAETDF